MNDLKFKNPFTRKWADDYKDDELHELNSHFSNFILPLIPKFADYPNVFLYGGSGTGKTMLFRHLSFEAQKNNYEMKEGSIISIDRFFEFSSNSISGVIGSKKSFLGIYRKLTEIPCKYLKLICKNELEEHNIFNFYLDLYISIKFINVLMELLEHYSNSQRKDIIQSKIICCVKGHSDLENITNLASIVSSLEERKNKIDLLLDNLHLNYAPKNYFSKEIKSIGGVFRLFFNIAKVLKQEVSEFKNVKIFILLDEYETIEKSQKRVINDLIRLRDRYLELKISSRRYGLETLQTLNPNDSISIGRDVELIDLEYVFMYENNKYKKLLYDIARKRLMAEPYFKKRKLTNIKLLLETISPEEEAKMIIGNNKRKLVHRNNFSTFLNRYNVKDIKKIMNVIKDDKNPLIEKLNMLLVKRRVIYYRAKALNERLYSDVDIRKMANIFKRYPQKRNSYYNLYSTNKLALLFQMCYEYGKYGERKYYAGFDTFADLSGGFSAWFLELCYFALEFAKDSKVIYNKSLIDIKSQERSAGKVAWEFLDNAIKNLEQVGSDLYYFVLNTGAFFRALHSDDLLREPEPTYFNTKTNKLDNRFKSIIQTAHYWSVLQSKIPMSPKTVGESLPDVHILHPILSPAFQISYRTRGRTDLDPNDVKTLIMGSEEDIRKLINTYRDSSLVKVEKRSMQGDLFRK
jgi:hypothetical protein